MVGEIGPEKALDHFDLLAPIYDRVIHPRKPVHLLSLFQPKTNRPVVLDVGGGTGRISQFFASQGYRVVIVDASHRMLEKALEKKGLSAVCAPGEQMPFDEGAFDHIIMIDAFHHVADQARTAKELFRVLKPGGRLIIEEPDVRRFAVKLIALAEKLALMRSRFYAPDEIGQFFDSAFATVTIQTEEHNAWVIVDKAT